MRVALLVTSEMKNTLPESLRVVADYGPLLVHDVRTEDKSREFTNGNHMILDGAEDTFISWLKPFDGFWVGKGNPMEQRFEIMHIK